MPPCTPSLFNRVIVCVQRFTIVLKNTVPKTWSWQFIAITQRHLLELYKCKIERLKSVIVFGFLCPILYPRFYTGSSGGKNVFQSCTFFTRNFPIVYEYTMIVNKLVIQFYALSKNNSIFNQFVINYNRNEPKAIKTK